MLNVNVLAVQAVEQGAHHDTCEVEPPGLKRPWQLLDLAMFISKHRVGVHYAVSDETYVAHEI